MGFYEKVLTQAGGTVGAVFAYLLNIQLTRIIEVVVYAAIGAGVGEGVKELVKWYKRKKHIP